MKVLILSTNFPRPENLNIGPWALDQALAIQNAGTEVIVISLNPPFPKIAGKLSQKIKPYAFVPNKTILSGVKVYYERWPYFPFYFIESKLGKHRWTIMSCAWKFVRKAVLKRVDHFKPDIIVANHTLVNGFLAEKLYNLTNIPYVCIDHEIADITCCDRLPIQKKIYSSIAGSALSTIAISKFMGNEIRSRFQDIRVDQIYNGGGFEEIESSVLKKPSLRTGMITVFCCTNFYRRKDVPLLIKAFDHISECHSHVILRIAGSGPDLSKIKNAIDNSKKPERISLLGQISKDDVKKEMMQADVFCLPGWQEPFGVVFLEAMSAGCAIILSEDAGAAELLENGKTAVFIKPRDLQSVISAFEQLLHDPFIIQSLGKKAYRHYKDNLGWSSTGRKYLNLFHELKKNRNNSLPGNRQPNPIF